MKKCLHDESFDDICPICLEDRSGSKSASAQGYKARWENEEIAKIFLRLILSIIFPLIIAIEIFFISWLAI